MQLFLGTHQHKVDGKGRLFLPKALLAGRGAEAGDSAGSEWVVTPGLDPCLYVFPRETFEQILEPREASAFEAQEYREAMRGLAFRSSFVQLDKQKRLLLPEHLRREIALGEEATVVGCGRHIEIWEPETWETIGRPRAEKGFQGLVKRFSKPPNTGAPS